MKPCTEGSNPSLSAICTGSGRRDRRRAVARHLVAAVLITASSGCVERYFRIETEPIGARIYINGEDAGASPVEKTFTHYGTMRVDAHPENQPGVTQFVELAPPWYEHFPFDLFSELFDPVTHVDRHTVTITFPEASAVPPADREAQARREAEKLRTESR